MTFSSSDIDQLAQLVSNKLGKASASGQTDDLNRLASAIAARLSGGLARSRTSGSRIVSEGMLRLASAVSYKLAKAEDPKTAAFNTIASEVAKTLHGAKQQILGSQPLKSHSGLNAQKEG